MTKEEKRRREHSESYKMYQKEYHKEYRERNKGYFIYMFVSKDGDLMYIGKTTNIYSRMSYHKCTKEYWEEGYTILYHEFKGINDDILIDIEQMLIELLKPAKNSKSADYDCSVDKYLNKDFNLKEYVI